MSDTPPNFDPARRAPPYPADYEQEARDPQAGGPPRPTEPAGGKGSTVGPHTATDPVTGEPNPEYEGGGTPEAQ